MPDALRWVLLALALLISVATALPLARKPYWWVRMFDFPRAQIVGVGLVAIALHLVTVLMGGKMEALDGAGLVVLVVCLGYQAARMAPYTPWYPTQSARVGAAGGAWVLDGQGLGGPALKGRTLRLVVSNVLMKNRQAERWAGVVRAEEPDVVAVVEVDAWWVDQIGAALPEYTHRVVIPQDDTYGMAVFSRLPLEAAEVRHLVEPAVPSVFARVVLPSGVRVQLAVLHPRPPRPDIQQGSEFRDAELVLAARALEGLSSPTLVAGDLNDVAWSHTTNRFQRLARLLDPRVGRGLYATYHADHPLLRYPLDHVFHSDDLGLVAIRRLGHVGSDHFPMFIEVAATPSAAARQEPPAPDADDVADAREAVETVREEQAEETPAERREREREDV